MRHGTAWRRPLLFVLYLGSRAWGSDGAATPAPVYESDMEAFIRTVDNEYPFLSLKGILRDWTNAKPGLLQRARRCTSDEEFLHIVLDAIRVLRDGHMGISPSKVKLPALPPRYYPGLSFLPATNSRVVSMYGPGAFAGALTVGTVVTKIDGADARGYLEQRAEAAWKQGGFFSSPQRARLFEYRVPLCGEQGQKHTIHYQDGDKERSLTLECRAAAGGWPHVYNLPGGRKQVGRSFSYTKLAQDVGYMYLRRVDTSIPEGIEEALQTYPNLKGWIVDLRGNGGGGYDNTLLEQIKRFPRPVAVLIDAGCVSAGETLARDFRSLAGARLFGSRTGGASSAKRTWSFPSGIASITLPVRSRWRNDGKPIEFNGIDPDVPVEAVPEELKAGNNSAILRAQEYILREPPRQCPGDAAPASMRPAPLPPVDSGRDAIIGWYKLLDTRRGGARYRGALIPIFKIEGTYYTALRGFEAPLKECPDGLEWSLKESSLVGTTIQYNNSANTCSIRIVDSARERFEESYVAKEAPFVPMTRVEKPSGLLDATARPPQTLDDFLGFYQPIWLPWIRFELRRDGGRYLIASQELDLLEPQGEWKSRSQPYELTPLSDRLGFAGSPAGGGPYTFAYNEALKRFELVLTKPGMRMPFAKVTPSTKTDAASPTMPIGIPAWH
jgi:hypothetical protein